MTFAPQPPPARSAPRGRAFFVPLRAVSPRAVPPNVAAFPPNAAAFRSAPPVPSPPPANLATPSPPLSAPRRATFRTSPPADDKALPLPCQNETTVSPSSHLVNPFTAMFHTALSALTAFYRTTVVILPLGHHRTLHLHTLPALLLIPYLAQLN